MPDMEKIEDYELESTHPRPLKNTQHDMDEILEPKIGIFHAVCRFVSGLFTSHKKVGELNGRWAALFKAVLILVVLTVPTFFAWATWVTNEAFAAKYHRMQTENYEARLIELEANMKILNRVELELSKMNSKIELVPAGEWKRRIELLETEYNNLNQELKQSEKINSDQHSQILVLLEGMKTKLDLLQK